MRRLLAVSTATVLLALGACAPKTVPKPTPGGETESFVKPKPGPKELDPKQIRRFDEAWARLEVGQWAQAAKKLRSLSRAGVSRPAVATASAYCTLRSGRYDEASRQFKAVLDSGQSSASALVGAALVAIRGGERSAALDLLRRASAFEPESAAIRRLLADTRIQVTEGHVSAARAAVEREELEHATEQYAQALAVAPEAAGVRLELAEALLSRQLPQAAIDVLGADPSADRMVRLRLAQVFAGQLEFDRAISVYQALLEISKDDQEARRGLLEARRSREIMALPEELRRVPTSSRLTRADLSALLVLRIPQLASVPEGEAAVAVDISGSWAREQIVRVLALRILEVYPNHTFQPGGSVRRGELATALARVLDLVGVDSRLASTPVLPDVQRNSPQFDAVARVVGLGLMDVQGAQGGFEPWRVVSGREAWDVVEALSRRMRRPVPGEAGGAP